MFTGIIVGTGRVTAVERGAGILHLSIDVREVIGDAKIGDSISVNGVCLTAVEIKGSIVRFELSGETLRATNLGALKIGDRVNLEPSLRADSRLSGHFVLGHVDGIGRIKSKTEMGEAFKVTIEVSKDIIALLVEKGSVAVDGISLTVVDILKDTFTVVIVPYTAGLTTIGFKGPGDTVNIEVDIIGKYVSRFMGGDRKEKSLMKTLTEEGYIEEKF
jgi:riboflavin synthase